ncbi:hypothetical protein [Baaleninema sp.]|uniref:hypothetical protein n=1 Tax=Baaleninema sp. TaxID=3101197 RepID=UPI003D021F37
MQYPLQEDNRPIVISYEAKIPKSLETTVSPKREPDRKIGDSWWSILLVAILSFSGLLSSPIPLVAFAAIASHTLPLKTAVSSLVWLWAIDRIYDVLIRPDSIPLNGWIWGGVAGLTALCILGLSPWLSPADYRISHRYLSILTSFATGFLLFQGIFFLVPQEISQNFRSIDPFQAVFFKEVFWAIALSGLHYFLLEIALPKIGKIFVGSFIYSTNISDSNR